MHKNLYHQVTRGRIIIVIVLFISVLLFMYTQLGNNQQLESSAQPIIDPLSHTQITNDDNAKHETKLKPNSLVKLDHLRKDEIVAIGSDMEGKRKMWEDIAIGNNHKLIGKLLESSEPNMKMLTEPVDSLDMKSINKKIPVEMSLPSRMLHSCFFQNKMYNDSKNERVWISPRQGYVVLGQDLVEGHHFIVWKTHGLKSKNGPIYSVGTTLWNNSKQKLRAVALKWNLDYSELLENEHVESDICLVNKVEGQSEVSSGSEVFCLHGEYLIGNIPTDNNRNGKAKN